MFSPRSTISSQRTSLHDTSSSYDTSISSLHKRRPKKTLGHSSPCCPLSRSQIFPKPTPSPRPSRSFSPDSPSFIGSPLGQEASPRRSPSSGRQILSSTSNLFPPPSHEPPNDLLARLRLLRTEGSTIRNHIDQRLKCAKERTNPNPNPNPKECSSSDSEDNVPPPPKRENKPLGIGEGTTNEARNRIRSPHNQRQQISRLCIGNHHKTCNNNRINRIKVKDPYLDYQDLIG
ncbi:hypothetical protein P9112_012768 [Eukaryota sp. TZLM1-RC]